MSVNPHTAADDRGYEVVWADEEGYETGEAVSEQLANGFHKVIGMGVRTCWAGDETAHRLAEALSRVVRVTLMHSNPNYRGGSFEWTLCFDAPDHRVIEEYRELVETILKSAVDQLWPHRHNHDGYVPVDGLYFSEYREAEDVPLDWHVLFARHQQAQGGNQARLPRAKHRAHARPTPPPLPAEDGLIFTNAGELRLYRALKRRQQAYDQLATIGIFPLPGMRIPGHTFEPDFLVTLKGRAGIIEIDGPQHRKRYAADKSKDHLLENAGIAFVSRIMPEDIDDPGELETFLDRFLRKLAHD